MRFETEVTGKTIQDINQAAQIAVYGFFGIDRVYDLDITPDTIMTHRDGSGTPMDYSIIYKAKVTVTGL